MTKRQRLDEVCNYRLLEKIRAGLLLLYNYPFPRDVENLRRDILSCIRQVDRMKSGVAMRLKWESVRSGSRSCLRRILSAKIMADCLWVTSSEFRRLKIPLTLIPPLAKQRRADQSKFELDEDGAYVYWRRLDLHLGWEQLEQIVDPVKALKARQKHHDFNVRYGKAIRALRNKAGINENTIPGLSGKQLRRIEKGECRLTSNVVKVLARVHKISPNAYMKLLAKNLR